MGKLKKDIDNIPETDTKSEIKPKKPKKEKKTTLKDLLKDIETDSVYSGIEIINEVIPNTYFGEFSSVDDTQYIPDIKPTVEVVIEPQKDKIYIVDTSVILNGVENIAILSQDNSNVLVIPETVLDELDNKKKGFTDINFQAREFNRMIDNSKVIGKNIFDVDGVVVTAIDLELDDNTKLLLVSKSDYKVNVNNELISIVNDRRILEVAQCMVSLTSKSQKELIVVSNDIALRARAISLNLKTQPLMKDRQSDIDDVNLIEFIDITSDFKPEIETKMCSPELFGKSFSNFTNCVFNCTDTGEQILTFYKNKQFYILNEKYLRSMPVKPKNKEQLFFMNMLLDKDVPIVVCSGVTGSGKNLLALVGGMNYVNNLDNMKLNSGIKYCRNTVTAGDEVAQLGFLKGDENQKLSVFSYPLIDSVTNYIEILQNESKKNKQSIPIINSKQFMEDNNINILNINQMRGSNVHGYVILDEWQSSSNSVTKLMLTRINEGSKVVILGDLNQIDNPYLNKYNNGLTKMLKLAQTEDIVAGIRLKKVQRGKIAEFAERVFND